MFNLNINGVKHTSEFVGIRSIDKYMCIGCVWPVWTSISVISCTICVCVTVCASVN